MTERETILAMRGILAEVRDIGPCLDGHLLKNKSNKYVKKDGTVSVYAAPAVLQVYGGTYARAAYVYRTSPAFSRSGGSAKILDNYCPLC